jgi:hypothetical protein
LTVFVLVSPRVVVVVVVVVVSLIYFVVTRSLS